jgi:hypothetical protein
VAALCAAYLGFLFGERGEPLTGLVLGFEAALMQARTRE